MSSHTADDLELMVESAQHQLREQIAANVEALGCKCQEFHWTASAHHPSVKACPLSIAAAIREGRL